MIMMPIELITAAFIAAPPVNDDWPDAMDLQDEGYPVVVNTIEATTSDVITNDSQCQNTFFTGAIADVWYRFSVGEAELFQSGVVEFTTCDLDGFDTDLALYDYNSGDPFQVACNGDAAFTLDCQDYYSTIRLTLSNGTYLLRVGGYNGQTGITNLRYEGLASENTVNGDFLPPIQASFSDVIEMEGAVVGGSRLMSGGPIELVAGFGMRLDLLPDNNPPCPGDLDGDESIGFSDVLIVLNDWGCVENCASDVDGDSSVGFSDVLIILNDWGACP